MVCNGWWWGDGGGGGDGSGGGGGGGCVERDLIASSVTHKNCE